MRGVEEEAFPLQGGEVCGLAAGVYEVEVGVKVGDALGDRDVILEHIDVVAAPRQCVYTSVRDAGGEDHAGNGFNDGGGAVGAGDPLGGGKGEGAGGDGNVDLSVVDMAGDVGEVGGDADGSLLGGGEGGNEKSEDGGLADHVGYLWGGVKA